MLNVETIRIYCLEKPGTQESFPFDEHTLVFKVGNETKNKIYALVPLEHGNRMNLKCDPDYALELREHHEHDILPGWHMNKHHWNTVMFNGSLSEKLVLELIDHSYDLIVASLPKKVQENL